MADRPRRAVHADIRSTRSMTDPTRTRPARAAVYTRGPRVTLMGCVLAPLDYDSAVSRIAGEIQAGRGGHLVTVNVQLLRQVHVDPDYADIIGRAELNLADGQPLVWASRLARTHLPERVAGADLFEGITARLDPDADRVLLVGGDGDSAAAAARVLRERTPGLAVATSSPWVAAHPTVDDVEAIAATVVEQRPTMVFIGMGAPKTERLIHQLRIHLGPGWDHVWWAGVGASFAFTSGRRRRAPRWVQRCGLEWAHRLVREPRRLGRRYLLECLPFTGALFMEALAIRRGHPQQAPAGESNARRRRDDAVAA